MNIIKELLSEVLEVEIIDFNIIGNKLNYIIPNYETEEDGDLIYIDLGQNINIYEFAFKCKEWALKKELNIFSSCKSFSIFQNGVLICSSSGEDNEIEAIIKACQWILENKSN